MALQLCVEGAWGNVLKDVLHFQHMLMVLTKQGLCPGCESVLAAGSS